VTTPVQGVDERSVVVSSEPKTVRRETAFERDMHPRHDQNTLQVIASICRATTFIHPQSRHAPLRADPREFRWLHPFTRFKMLECATYADASASLRAIGCGFDRDKTSDRGTGLCEERFGGVVGT
jgi:hypothetical protein